MPQNWSGPSVSRREALLVGGVGIAIGLAACTRSNDPTGAGHPGELFKQPAEQASRNGTLAVTLRAEQRTVPFGDGRRFAYTYNGTTPGPTLRVRPGDRLEITLENHLDEPTNLHTHGLHVSPGGSSDNIFVRVDPGQSHTYIYEIPTDHRPSLCWYHPHHHGLVAPQIAAGLAGAIIVGDDLDTAPELATATQRMLILQDPKIGTSSSVLRVTGMAVMQGREGDAALVNGLERPVIGAAAGTLEHWRMLNASPSRYYRLALDDHQLHIIATDGGRLARPVAVDEVLLAPGERVEALIVPAGPGTHTFRTLGYDRGAAAMGSGMMGGSGRSSSGAQELATVKISASTGPAGELPRQLVAAATLDAGTADSERTVTLGMGMGGGRNGSMGMGGGGSMMSFTINGASFDPERIDVRAALGTTEDWVISNTSPMDHPFHLHAWPFRVIERTSGPADLEGWKDTVNVPAGSTVRIRIPFRDITGRTVYHCHILDHEDQGMMGIIEVD